MDVPQQTVLLEALEAASGPALVLDNQLRIIAATPSASSYFSGKVPVGVRAPRVLCGQNEERPVAEALARGESASSEIILPTETGEAVIGVRTVPLKASSGQLSGHLIFMTPVGEAHEGVSEVEGILSASENMRSLLRVVAKVARADAPVLVRGETGSGKELVARAVHALSPRKNQPFAAINCAALPPQLLESELFGHVRGAFTGAVKDHDGHFRRVEGGTLFLDEVAELPLEVQAKLLRVTQEKSVLPLGGSRPVPVDVRLVSATHRSLRQAVAEGSFRADLMYRLRVLPVFLPPLRERPLDVELLAKRFVTRLNEGETERRVERISPGALGVLKRYDWPGNVRELQNAIEFAFWLGEGPVLQEADLPPELREGREPLTPQGWTEQNGGEGVLSAEGKRILRALERASGNRERAASALGMSRSTLWRKMRKHGIDND